MMQMLRKCDFCGNEFIPHIRHPNQKTCGSKCSLKVRYQRNKDLFLKKSKERYERVKNTETYKERVRNYQRSYRLRNPEKVKQIDRRYKQKYKEEILARLRKYELKERTCTFCSKVFLPDKNHPLAKCCSQICRNKLWAKNNLKKFKQINIEKSKKYRLRHPEKIKDYTRKLVESGKANINAKRWRERNLDRAKELRREQYWKYREKNLNYAKKYRQTEAGKLAHRADSKRRQFVRKSKLAIDFPLTRNKQDYIRNRDNNTCVYCHDKPNIITFDHIIAQENKGNNSINNLVVSCMGCNGSKRHKLLDEWLTSEYCKEKSITQKSINPIVWGLLKKQKEQEKLIT